VVNPSSADAAAGEEERVDSTLPCPSTCLSDVLGLYHPPVRGKYHRVCRRIAKGEGRGYCCNGYSMGCKWDRRGQGDGGRRGGEGRGEAGLRRAKMRERVGVRSDERRDEERSDQRKVVRYVEMRYNVILVASLQPPLMLGAPPYLILLLC